MQLGPYDGRKKRSRCVACAASHLKCSSQQPCTACTRRGMTCTYPAPRTAAVPIIVESSYGRQLTKRRATRQQPSSTSIFSLATPSSDPSGYYMHHFYAFVGRNDFTGKAAAVQNDLQHLSRVGAATYLRDAMLAIGAMHAANMGMHDGPDGVVDLDSSADTPSLRLGPNLIKPTGRRRAALEYYAAAVSGLSRTLAAASCNFLSGEDLRDAILWTTLLLGFYELMNETPPGEGWRLHMVHGTGRALRASGAACCRRGRSRTFFLQARVFEVFRAVICSDATFLTDPEWTNLLDEMWVDGAAGNAIRDDIDNNNNQRGWHPLDSLLDVVAQCTKLRFRIRGFLAQCRDGVLTDEEVLLEGTSISSRAVSLRKALDRWSATYSDEAVFLRIMSSSPDTAPVSPTPANPNLNLEPCSTSNSSSSTFSSTPPSSTTTPSSFSSPSTPPADPLTTDPSLLLAHVFCAAANAYLSGIFDYEMDQWHAIRQQPPTLTTDQLQVHVDTILRYAAPALANTNIAPILLLFPLRIAGARSRYPRQRTEVLRLLAIVGQMYAAARYYSAHLQRLWVRMAEEERQKEKGAHKSSEARPSKERTPVISVSNGDGVSTGSGS